MRSSQEQSEERRVKDIYIDTTEYDDHRLPEWAIEEFWREVGPLREDNFS